MKPVRGSNRAATKAPRKQTQQKSKKSTAKRAAKDQVKCPRAVQCLHFAGIVSLVLFDAFSVFSSQTSVRTDRKANRKQQKRGQVSVSPPPPAQVVWLSVWMFPFYRNISGMASCLQVPEVGQTGSRSQEAPSLRWRML